MKDAYYFPHDSNARNDEKCLYIINKYGLTGYGLYWAFIECMHDQSDGKLTSTLIDGLAVPFNTDITLLKQFYNDAITINLFVTDGVKYWSERVLRNKQLFEEKRTKKSQAGIKGMQSRWGFDNTVITKHNKVKESKVKKSIVNTIVSSNEDTCPNKNSDAQKVFEHESIPYRLAIKLSKVIHDERVNPTAKKQDEQQLQKWALTFDRMIRLDKREPKDINNVFEYALFGDIFWRTNMLSAEAVRKHYDRVYPLMIKDRSG